MSVQRTMREVDAREFALWCHYFRTEEQAEDWRLARLMAHITQVAGGKAKPSDYMPKSRRHVQSTAEMKARLKAFADAYNRRRLLERQRGRKNG